LEVSKDYIVLGKQEVHSTLMTGISPLKNEPGQYVYKGEVLTT
jgi:hypothetical protein